MNTQNIVLTSVDHSVDGDIYWFDVDDEEVGLSVNREGRVVMVDDENYPLLDQDSDLLKRLRNLI